MAGYHPHFPGRSASTPEGVWGPDAARALSDGPRRELCCSRHRRCTWCARPVRFLGLVGRYECDAVATGAMGALIIWHRAIATLVSHGSSALIAASIAILLYVGTYVISTLRTPVASSGIFEQQYQMHRFAVDFYKHPVGVNDLGLGKLQEPELCARPHGSRIGDRADRRHGQANQLGLDGAARSGTPCRSGNDL